MAVTRLLEQNPCQPFCQTTPTGRRLSVSARLPRILVAVGDHEMRALLKRALERVAYEVDPCENSTSLRAHLILAVNGSPTAKTDLLVCDVRLLDNATVQVMESRQRQGQLPPLVLVTAFADQTVQRRVRSLRSVTVFDKVLDIYDQLAVIRDILPHQQRRTC